MRQKKTLVLAERDLGGNRIYVVKSMVNSIGYSIGQELQPVVVDRLISCPSWTVKIVAAVVDA